MLRRIAIRLSIGSLAVFAASGVCAAQPRVFYTDLESGPGTGGENNAGAFVSVYGKGFGASPGSVTIGGGRAFAYPVWTDTRVTFQLGSAAATGSVVVTTAAGSSNGIAFTVRAGRIFFVSVTGADGNSGLATAPWRTIQRARDAMTPGDITYVRDRVTAATNDDWSACLILGGQSGTAGNPIALVAYPGETATIGNVSPSSSGGCDHAIRTKGQGEHYWVFAGLVLRGGGEAISAIGVQGWRIVGNDLSCPNGDGPSSCLGTGGTSNMKIYGNNIHDVGHTGSSALYHGVYIGTDSYHTDIGWNTVANVKGCRGIQVYASGGADLYDLQIHENIIHDTQCDGIILASVDPSQPGGVNVYNNVIYNAGKGPRTPEDSGAFYCINVRGDTNAGKPGSGTIEVFNNTMFACGTWTGEGYFGANGAVTMNGANPSKRLRLRNNIIVQTVASPYLIADDGNDKLCGQEADCPRVYGSNNLFWGNGGSPLNPNVGASINADPQFVSLQLFDFHLKSTSPARGAGVTSPASVDMDGLPRTSPGDLGAFQYAGAVVATLRCNPGAVITPAVTTCTVTLSSPAPQSGLKISIGSDNPSIVTPLSMDITAGTSSMSFSATAKSVSSVTQATVSATVETARVAAVIWLVPTGDTTPVVASVTNAASFLSEGISPGSIITAFGVNLGGGSAGRLRALFDGVPAPVIAAQSNQISVAAPYSLAVDGSVRFEVEVDGRLSNSSLLAVRRTTPGVFALDASGSGPALVFNADGSVNHAGRPAPKDSIVLFYASGLGQTDPPSTAGQVATGTQQKPLTAVSVEIGGVSSLPVATTSVAGLLTGVFQIAVRVPSAVIGGQAVPLLIRTADGASQPGMTIAIQ